MGEGFVGFGHLVNVFFFLMVAPSLLEAATISATSFSAMDLPERLRLYPISHLMDKEIFLSGGSQWGSGSWHHRYGGFLLHTRSGVAECFFPNLITILSGLLLHSFQGIVEYGEGSALLALPHQIVHELGHQRIVVLGIRVDDVLF